MRHVHDRHGVRRYNFHLGWTDVRRRERTASGPSFLWTRVRSHPFTHTLPMQHRMEPSLLWMCNLYGCIHASSHYPHGIGESESSSHDACACGVPDRPKVRAGPQTGRESSTPAAPGALLACLACLDDASRLMSESSERCANEAPHASSRLPCPRLPAPVVNLPSPNSPSPTVAPDVQECSSCKSKSIVPM